MTHFCNFGTQEAEEGECLSWKATWAKQQDPITRKLIPPQHKKSSINITSLTKLLQKVLFLVLPNPKKSFLL